MEIRKRIPLTEDQKKGLTNEQIFAKEYGLYTSWFYSKYWTNKFKEIYGCMPAQP